MTSFRAASFSAHSFIKATTSERVTSPQGGSSPVNLHARVVVVEDIIVVVLALAMLVVEVDVVVDVVVVVVVVDVVVVLEIVRRIGTLDASIPLIFTMSSRS